MSKKYLSLEEAAAALNVSTSELMRMREQQEIRGFADRGNWKFKAEDVEALARNRADGSDPEVPLFDESADVGEQPTVISKGDSDDLPLSESDSDVKLVGLGSSAEIPTDDSKTSPEIDITGSDSDVRLSTGSDSDASLMDSETIATYGDDSPGQGSDSDVKLVSDDNDASDVTLMSGDETEAQPINLSDDDQLVLAEESGISLAGDSSLMLGGESGINLEGPADSGIELTADEDDEGITLDLGDDDIGIDVDESGISLDSFDDDSGISLEDDDFSGTIPMMDAVSDDSVPETQFEIPPLDDESDVFDLQDSTDDTGVLDMSELEDSADDAVFDLDEDDDEFGVSDSFEDDDLELEDDVFDDDEDLDVFDADDDVFDDEDEESYVGRASGRMGGAEAEWGAGIFVGLIVSSLLLIVCGAVMIDLVNNMANPTQPNPLAGAILKALGGLYTG